MTNCHKRYDFLKKSEFFLEMSRKSVSQVPNFLLLCILFLIKSNTTSWTLPNLVVLNNKTIEQWDNCFFHHYSSQVKTLLWTLKSQMKVVVALLLCLVRRGAQAEICNKVEYKNKVGEKHWCEWIKNLLRFVSIVN